MNAPLLDVVDLRVSLESDRGDVRAVDGVSFVIRAGETFGLLGESGCGKSMTAMALMRLLPDAGRVAGGAVTLDGEGLLGLTEARMREFRGRAMAMIFQDPSTSLNPVLSVRRQLVECLRNELPNAPATEARALALLQAVGIPDPQRRLDAFPFQLSGGMKQRVMIAMALAAEPRLLIADEPTTALDVTIQEQVLQVLEGLRSDRNMAMLLITHDLGVVARMAHRVGVMYAGELVEVSGRDALFAGPRHPYTRKLMAALPDSRHRGKRLDTIPGTVPSLHLRFAGCRFAERCDRVMYRCRDEVPDLVEVAPGHRVRCHLAVVPLGLDHLAGASDTSAREHTRVGGCAAVPLLEVVDLQVHFPIRRGVLQREVGRVRAVDGVSLQLAAGRTLALVGESGCGKTTAGKAILRLIQPSAGQVRINGLDITAMPTRALREHRRDFQIVFQDPYASLNPRMRVGEAIAEGMSALGVGSDARTRDRRVSDLLGMVGLTAEMASRFPHEFSGGQRQRIAIARALAVGPKLLVCDEPTSALDVSVQAQILNLLSDLQSRLGLAYLFITHNIGVVDYLAHEVAVMYLGRIVERGQVDEVLRSARHPYTQALLAAVPKLPGDGLRPASAVPLLVGELPSPANPPTGCHFHPRCARAAPLCREHYPGAVTFSGSHHVTCHFPA